MSQIKYIFRDFWWTVAKLDIPRDGYMTQIMRAYKMSKDDVWQYLSLPMSKFRRGEIAEDVVWKTFAENMGKPLHAACLRVFHKPLEDYSRRYKTITTFIQKLHKLWYYNVILSDEFEPQSKKARKLWWYNWFDEVLLSHEIGLSKHDDKVNASTKIFEYALKKYKIKPEEALFIDDMAANCLAAQRAGIQSVIAKGPRQTVKEVKKILHSK